MVHLMTTVLIVALLLASGGADENTVAGVNSNVWPGGVVPYDFDYAFEDSEQQRITSVVNRLNRQAVCVRFRRRNDNDVNYVNFVKTDSKCQSQGIGYSNELQSIYLSPDCAQNEPFIFKVLLQVLGLPLEHKRPDRDSYVTVNWENIEEGHKNDFSKYSFIDPKIAALPYDIHSRLHYPGDKFSKGSGLLTMEAISDPSAELGNNNRPTALDYQKVAALYCQQQQQSDNDDGSSSNSDANSISAPAVQAEQQFQPQPPPDTTQTPVTQPIAVRTKTTTTVTLPPTTTQPETAPTVKPVVTAKSTPRRFMLPDFNSGVGNKCECFTTPGPFGRCSGGGGSVWKGERPSICNDVSLNPCWCAVSRNECDANGCAPDVYCEKICLQRMF